MYSSCDIGCILAVIKHMEKQSSKTVAEKIKFVVSKIIAYIYIIFFFKLLCIRAVI